MRKKDMINILVEHEGFSESGLNKKLKEEIEEIFNQYYDVVEVEIDSEEGLKYGEDYIETNHNRVLSDKSSSEEPKLSKGEMRRLRRIGII